MAHQDPDRIRLFTTEEHWNPAGIVSEIRSRVEFLRDFTDLIGKSRSSKISDNRIKICQDLLKTYESTLFAFHHDQKIGSLSDSQQREVLVMVDDILRGKREYAHFQLTRNGDGIKELLSSKIFTIK
jgi:hypothetical protein